MVNVKLTPKAKVALVQEGLLALYPVGGGRGVSVKAVTRHGKLDKVVVTVHNEDEAPPDRGGPS